MKTLTLWFREAPKVTPNNVDIEYSVEQSESGDGDGKLPSKPWPDVQTEAFNYLDLVKAEFHNQPEIYNLFLDVMKAIRELMLDTPGVIEHVTYLFEGKGALLHGFNSFLPPGYTIPLDSHSDPNFSWSLNNVPVNPVDHSNGGEFNHYGVGEGMVDESDDHESDDPKFGLEN
jgi:histone deacetylase complex regulatory component SIN3